MVRWFSSTVVFGAICLGTALGCGGKSTTTPAPAVTPSVSSITVTPAAPSLLSGTTVSVSALVAGVGAYNTGMSWTILSGPGTLSASTGSPVIYSAPSVTAATVVQIQATSLGTPAMTAVTSLALNPFTSVAFPTSRSALTWPFASTSIWNTPIGSGAVYVPAQLGAPTGGMSADQDVIILTPTSPLTSVYTNTAAWTGADRCPASDPILYTIPMPASLVIPNSGENNSMAALMPDGATLCQTQPFTRCTAGGPATALNNIPAQTLEGDGRRGAHGGSGLSSLGGTLRIGDLRPQSGPVRHALKVNLNAKAYLCACVSASGCFRWPAFTGDGYAIGYYGGTVTALKMGALLAIPAGTALGSLGLETEPGLRLAWTLQNYGAYVVDDTYWPSYAIETEQGPAGSFLEQFQADWGFSLIGAINSSAMVRDWYRLFQAAAVVDSNAADAVGGGGTPLQPLAPPFM